MTRPTFLWSTALALSTAASCGQAGSVVESPSSTANGDWVAETHAVPPAMQASAFASAQPSAVPPAPSSVPVAASASESASGPMLASLEDFAGIDFQNAFSLRTAWKLEEESVLGVGDFGILVLRNGDELGVVVDRRVSQDPPTYHVLSTKRLGVPCTSCTFVTLCQVGGRQDPWVFGWMSDELVCGGWGKSHPGRAWRGDAKGGIKEVPISSVTCGTRSCEGP